MSYIKKHLFPLLIFFITLFICFRNYTPNTFLTGWDTLHPEFNFSLNFQRLLSFWHSEQGLGAIPAHAQISDIPRVFILYLFHFILPLNFLRYSYIFLCLILGPLGVYYLLKHLFHQNSHSQTIAFLTSLFYLFNLSTVQQFYVPFEMFPTQWAYLPWIILFSLKYLQVNSRKNLIIFSFLTFFATPQAYASQLWYAFFFIYTAFLLLYSFFHRPSFKKSLSLIIFTLLINAFWLIPNVFYILNSRSAPTENRDNRLYSQEYLLRNRQNGNIKDISLIKGFYLDWSAFNPQTNSFTDLMPQWQNHLKNPIVLFIGYVLFISSFSGLIICFIKKDKNFIIFSPFFIIPFVLLANQIPPFSFLFDFLIKNSTLKEAFRFIFTKLSILLLFGYTLYFSYFLHFIFHFLQKKSKIIIVTVIPLSLFLYCSPMFFGYLISPITKVNIPNDYFQLWQFMSQQTNERVLSLPLNQSSGWQYYNWGYQGSGFLWFNLQQNLLDRDSDRWSIQNEQSYREFFYSLYSQNFDQFNKLLQKYQIKYIIWDKNIVSSLDQNNDQVVFKNETQKLLNQLTVNQQINPINQINNLLIYKVNLDSGFDQILPINQNISPTYSLGYYDPVKPNYISTINTNQYYPIRDILNNKQQIDPTKVKITQLTSNQYQIDIPTNNFSVKMTSIFSQENLIPASVYIEPTKDNNYQIIFDLPFPKEITAKLNTQFNIQKHLSSVSINDKTFSLPTINQKFYLGQVNIFVKTPNYINNQAIDFNFNQKNTSYLSKISFNSTGLHFQPQKKFNNLNKADSYSLDLNSLPQSFGYIVGIQSQFFSGLPLRICLKNEHSLVCSFEDQLDENQNLKWNYFLIPSTSSNTDQGYNLTISSISYNNPSKSLLNQITIIPVPFNLLNNSFATTANQSTPSNFYILNQTFNKNWRAFYFQNGIPVFLNHHVLANNWANAWELPDNYDPQSTIYTLFWPQIFQYLGLTISSISLILVFRKHIVK
ncbi:MAG: hypothetical protein KIH89_003485 [Candidatus Shapirobacteria bacterium]|nr:hypothetical protein [Candidatus Shapirobacteria bacterium]